MTAIKITGTSEGVVLQQAGQTIVMSADDAHDIARRIVMVALDVDEFQKERQRQLAALRLWAEERGIAM